MQNIIIYGMRWTWKSSIWKELTKKLNYNFIDLDIFISEKNNSSLSDFIENVGWKKFRDEEYNCLKEVLKIEWNNIISLWWWTIIFDRNRELINSQKNNQLIYLNTSLENISNRILKDEKSWDIRNSLTWKSVLEELKQVFKERKDIYKNNCDFEVDNNWTIKDSVLEIERKINYWWICVPVISPHLASPQGRGIIWILEFFDEIKNDRKIEYIELRLDLMFNENIIIHHPSGASFNTKGSKFLKEIIEKCPKKVICTNRAKFEWWEFEWSCDESLELLNKCLEFWADYIDIELESLEKLSTEGFSPLNNSEWKINNKLIISHHNFSKTPEFNFLKNILEKMSKYSPAVYKIAVTPENKKDVEKVFELNKYFKENYVGNAGLHSLHRNIFISMWKLWEKTRFILPKYWNLLSFWTYWKTSSAPGQINYKNLHKKIFEEKEVLFLWWPQISWSFSPFMHNYSSNKLEKEENKFRYKLEKIEEYSKNDAQNFIKKLESDEKYLWGNITMPYKIDVYKYLLKLNRLEKNAKLVWAVNTLFKKDWIIYWTNTDLEWIKNPILERIVWNDFVGSAGLQTLQNTINSCYILWAGWASRAAIAAMIDLKIENIFVLNRGQKGLDEIEKHFKKYLWENQKLITKIYDVPHPHPQPLPCKEGNNKIIIINTLPFWFKENLPKSPIKFEELEKIKNNLVLYFEAVYDSERWDTPIVEEILKINKNTKICRWIEMLIWQAKTWFELWSEDWVFRSEEITDILMKK